jgi:hypothetical protein
VTRRLLLSVLLVVMATSCGRDSTTAVKPTTAAYSDGFEVVVYDVDNAGAVSNVRSLPLREAEQAIAAGAKAMLPADPAPVAKALPTGKSGDSRAYVTATQLPDGKQQVRLSFHQSSRTFVYEYVVQGGKVTPTRSEYRDLAKATAVQYSGQ